MTLRIKKFGSISELNLSLGGAVIGHSDLRLSNGKFFLHGLTLVFNEPSDTVTFAATPAGAQSPMTLNQVFTQISTQTSGAVIPVLTSGGSLAFIGASSPVNLDAAGTANAALGFSTSEDTVGTVYSSPGSSPPNLVSLHPDSGSYSALVNDELGPGGSTVSSAGAAYTLTAVSGLITGASAGTGSAGHLFVAQYLNTLRDFYVTRLRMYWQTIVGFTAAQEMALAAFFLTDYANAHTGGTAVTPLALVSSSPASSLACRIAATGDLTADGSPPTIGNLLLRGSFSELADSATTQKGFIDEQNPGVGGSLVCILTNETGILVRNEIAMGAGGTGRLVLQLDGYER